MGTSKPSFQPFDILYELIVNHQTDDPVKLLDDDISQIICAIDKELFQVHNQEEAKFYIKKAELAISNFERCIQRQFNRKPSASRIETLDSCLLGLDEIRYHLESTYTVYRDSDQYISKKSTAVLVDNMTVQGKRLEKLLKHHDLDKKLINIVLQPLNKITRNHNQKITQHQFDYLQHFTLELGQLQSFNTIDNTHLLQFLYLVNFNSIALLSYICNQLKQSRADIADDKAYLDHLHLTKHYISRIPTINIQPYNPNLKDLKTQVSQWIKEEIHLVKKEMSKQKGEKQDLTKLNFNHSVDTITGLFRLFYETGIIKSGANQTVRWISRSLSSKKQQHISQQSIQRKFFDKYTNKEPLKEIIIQLLNHLNHK